MFLLFKHFHDLHCNGGIKAPDVFDRCPREKVLHEKFRHLLMLFALPLRRSNGFPVERIKRFDFGFECSVVSASVSAADGPSLFQCQPVGHRAYQMENASLAPRGVTGVSLVDC